MAFFSFDSFAPSGKAVKKPEPAAGPAPAQRKRGRSPSSSSAASSRAPAGKKRESASSKSGARGVSAAEDERLDALIAEAAELKTCAELVRRFVRACLREWRTGAADEATSAEGKREAPPAVSTLQPLIDYVCAKALDKEEEDKIKRTCLLSLSGEHLQAQQAYIELVIGSAKWPIGGMYYISSDMPKGNERCWAQKYRKIEEKGSLLDNDAVRVALQGFKRLLTFMETRGAAR